MAKEYNLLSEEGWRDVNEGLISHTKLQEWIKDYFSKEEDLSLFKLRNKGYLELVSEKGNRGYVFVGELQIDRDHEKRMSENKRIYENGLSKRIIRSFVDSNQGFSGFYWENSNKSSAGNY